MSDSQPQAAEIAAPAAQTKGHPHALYLLFATEMWERFCFYGMRAILVPFLRYELHWQPAASSSTYKWYTSLVYLTPMIGGMLADRYLGVRLAIVIGAVLLSVGEFVLTGRGEVFLYGGLALLVFGNGFFKPNISTVVGKLYLPGDPRRDGAFTIFYMGINLGAALGTFICGWFAESETFGYRWGFGAAGVGMAVALVTFLLGQKRLKADVEAAGNTLAAGGGKKAGDAKDEREPDEDKPGADGFAGMLSKGFPMMMIGSAILLPIYFGYRAATGHEAWTDVIMPIAFALIAGWMGATLMSIKGAARDKSSVIFLLFLFVVLFWMAFEQAGNALNIWAFENTTRTLFGLGYPATWWQNANSFFIVALATPIAFGWTWLERKGIRVTTPTKMFLAMVFVAAAFGTMVVGAMRENAVEARVTLAEVPKAVAVEKFDAGRLSYDGATKELVVRGVLPTVVAADLLAATVDAPFGEAVKKVEGASKQAAAKAPVTTKLESLPAGFAFPYDAAEAEKRGMKWEPASGTLVLSQPLGAAEKVALLGAGSPPTWRKAVTDLTEKSNAARVSGFWLVLQYLFATLGELCLSPVGLSMVTKLAPKRFASLFMGVWFLAPSMALYAGGAIGEMWGSITPVSYFWIFVGSSLAGALVLLALVPPLKRLMHDVT